LPSDTVSSRDSGFTGTLRVLGLGVDLTDEIEAIAEADLGFSVEFEVSDTLTMEDRVLLRPDSFDVFSGYAHELDRLWPSGNLQPIEIARIERWAEISSLFKVGKSGPGDPSCTLGDGDAPFRKMYLDPDATGEWPSSAETIEELQGTIVQWVDEETGETIGDEPAWVTGVPQTFAMDALGFNSDEIPVLASELSWAELLNESYRGRVALPDDPGIAVQDVANAAQALGISEFGSLGNLTSAELDGVFALLSDLDARGHWRSFWATPDESVSLMALGEVVLASMWPPAVSLLVAQGFPAVYASPPEGFRGWAALQAISSSVEDETRLAACYEYLNWWHSGEPGAIMMRQGYYNAVQETSRAFVSDDEWDYWIEGLPAGADLPGITGRPGDVPFGSIRDGGSFLERSCRYSCWNSFLEEQALQTERWREFRGV
jgi:putative spermidine/putrescine transport system substrate-binding protein